MIFPGSSCVPFQRSLEILCFWMIRSSVDGMALYQTVQGLLKSFLFRKNPDEKKTGFDGFIRGS
jgi:hypothetical protein